ncbi:MAG: FtsQ-type POTRA domain-containing protein [Clostridia bacterium]|nr:FtsQ-type POTRA domain-containing protein [Clostridia bacterium]
MDKGHSEREQNNEKAKPGRPNFDFRFTDDDLAVGTRASRSASESKDGEAKAEREIDLSFLRSAASRRRAGEKVDDEPEPAEPAGKKPEGGQGEKSGDKAKGTGAKKKGKKKEDELDTSSIAEARGISHEARRRKQDMKDLIRLLVLLLILGAFVAAGIWAFRYTTVKTISVTGSEKYGQAQLLSISRIRAGKNILFYNERALADDMNAIPDIRTVSVKKVMPDRIDIVVSDITACAAILSPNGEYTYVSEDGYVLSMGEETDGGLTVIRGMTGSGLSLNTYINSKESSTIRSVAAVKLMKAINESGLSGLVTEIDLASSAYVTITVGKNYTIVLGSISTAHECMETAAKAYEKFLPEYPNGGTIQVFPDSTVVDFTPAN